MELPPGRRIDRERTSLQPKPAVVVLLPMSCWRCTRPKKEKERDIAEERITSHGGTRSMRNCSRQVLANDVPAEVRISPPLFRFSETYRALSLFWPIRPSHLLFREIPFKRHGVFRFI